MADFRLRIGFAKEGAAVWLSHLEVVRAMERCVRRSGLPYAISQGFSPHMKHSFSPALPVGTGSKGEYMDVDLESLVNPKEAIVALKAAEHENLPVLSVEYVQRSEPSLQVYYNLATYSLTIEFVQQSKEAAEALTQELMSSLQAKETIEVVKKGKPKSYDLALYVQSAEYAQTSPSLQDTQGLQESQSPTGILLTVISRPEGSLRPEVILNTFAGPEQNLKIASIIRTHLEHKEL